MAKQMTTMDYADLLTGDDMPTDEDLQRIFHTALAENSPRDAKRGLRVFASGLLERGLIDLASYATLFGGQAVHLLTLDQDGHFIHALNGKDATDLTRIYSRAKYGSIADIRFLADLVIERLRMELQAPDSDWRRLFEGALAAGEQVVMLTTGWRNVPSTANVLFAIVVEQINVDLALLELPTIIEVKLPRIAPPVENYASLTAEERERVSKVQDHVIPEQHFFQGGVHVIFGDDVLVTGATADKVFHTTMMNGARSFRAVYPVVIDPVVAFANPATEEKLNMTDVDGKIDESIVNWLSDPDYQPILRTLRLLFEEASRGILPRLLPLVPPGNWLKLYTAALGNDMLRVPSCQPSLELLKGHLTQLNMLDGCGRPLRQPTVQTL